MSKLTRQGVRDLGGNGQRKPWRCLHRYGPVVVIDKQLVADPFDGWLHYHNVYGQRCIWCGHTRRDPYQ